MIILVDNYDSFTYNLYQYLEELGGQVLVLRNDAFAPGDIERRNPSGIVISPGPGIPSRAGLTEEVIRLLAGSIPIFGVCLGHQAVAEVFGARIQRAGRLMHGKCDEIFHRGGGVFEGVPSPFTATRYHSLTVSGRNLPDCLKVTARSGDGEIMGIEHRRHRVYGVQFHPESVMTAQGKRILGNFLKITAGERRWKSKSGNV